MPPSLHRKERKRSFDFGHLSVTTITYRYVNKEEKSRQLPGKRGTAFLFRPIPNGVLGDLPLHMAPVRGQPWCERHKISFLSGIDPMKLRASATSLGVDWLRSLLKRTMSLTSWPINFKVSMGVTPYRWLVRHRIEATKAMLLKRPCRSRK